ncbi:DUF1345 domain-containing protein [Phenylobacterium sp.]|uniref:DUF1345 domain-containing protein n=1 Tax=Phenylobacterium sp. TaxID=1871053 RepID=UPI0025F1EC34|nr:DUF1345 domain-containing protein [Phenylobacterium sp.]
MQDTVSRRRRHWRVGLRVFAARPRLVIASGVGLAVGLACGLVAHLRLSACAIAGWDTFCVVFLALALSLLVGKGPVRIRTHAATQDEGQLVILALVLVACAASLGAAALELSLAKGEHGLFKGLHVTVAVATVAASWLVMQVILALHYAHEYYARDPETGSDHGGLKFPGRTAPDYWDFLHFSIVIGVAAQTADIAFTDRRMRRLGTLHSLIAFVFNTLIVALTINLAAGLF